MRNVNPRAFNKLVYVEQATTTRTAANGDIHPVFSLFCTAWASIEPVAGRELHEAKGVEADLTHRVRMAWNGKTAQITPKHRIRYTSPTYGDRYLNIISVSNIEERNRLLEIKAMEQTE